MANAIHSSGVGVIADSGIPLIRATSPRHWQPAPVTVMPGRLFAGHRKRRRASGHSTRGSYKSYCGMGSLGAMQARKTITSKRRGAAKLVPEGIKARSVQRARYVASVVHQLEGGIPFRRGLVAVLHQCLGNFMLAGSSYKSIVLAS